MGRPERPPAPEAHMVAGKAGHRIDLGSNHRFLQAHGWQDARHGLGDGALPGARGTHQKHVVTACSGDFHPAFGFSLAQDIGKIHPERFVGSGPPAHLPAGIGLPDEQVLHRLLFLQDAEGVVQRPDSVHPDAFVVGRIQGRYFRKDAAGKALFLRQFHHGKGAGDRPDAAVQPQLSHYQILVQAHQFPLSGGGDDAQRDGKVIPAAAFVKIGRGQVDDKQSLTLPIENNSLYLCLLRCYVYETGCTIFKGIYEPARLRQAETGIGSLLQKESAAYKVYI